MILGMNTLFRLGRREQAFSLRHGGSQGGIPLQPTVGGLQLPTRARTAAYALSPFGL